MVDGCAKVEYRGVGCLVQHKLVAISLGVGLDSDRAIYDLYASNYIPRTFIVNKQGKVVYRTAGYDETIAEEVNAALRKALK